MARTIYQYQQYNTNPDKAVGIKLPFNKPSDGRSNDITNYSSSASGLGVFVSSYSTEEQAVSNLKNLLLTSKGERVMQPNFGTTITRLVFEQNVADLATELETELTTDIEYWLPYIIIKNIEVKQYVNDYSIIIRLTFSVTESGANLVINLLASENSLTIVNTDATGNQRLTPISTLG